MEPLEEIFKTNVLRLIANGSLKEISALSGVPYRSLQNARKGTIPQAKNLQKLADYWGIRPEEPFRPEGSQPPGVEALADELAKRNARIKQLDAALAVLSEAIKGREVEDELAARVAALKDPKIRRRVEIALELDDDKAAEDASEKTSRPLNNPSKP